MEIRRLLGKGFGKAIEALKRLRALRFRISRSSLMQASILSVILFIASIVRLLPIRWGFHLSEFDPYFHYRVANYMVENGFFAWVNWHDYQRWYPYGQNVGRFCFPSLALTAAFFYKIIEALRIPISLYDFCVIFPVIMGTLTVLITYFLGKDVGGVGVGLFSALFLALNPSHIGRTSLGFFDDETIGIFSILLLSYLFLRSIDTERTFNSSLAYAVASGLTLGYVCAGWGASMYPMAILAFFAFALILLKRYSRKSLLSYSVTFGLGLFIAINIPRIGFRFLFNWVTLSTLGVFALLCLCEILNHIRSTKRKVMYTLGFFLILGSALVVLLLFGYATPIGGKFISVVNPFEREAVPLFQSVAEHRVTAWGSFYYDFGIGIFFFLLGLYFAIRNPTNRNLFLVIYGLTALYSAGSLVRLSILLAPAFCLLWATGLTRLLSPFITIMKEVPKIPFKKKTIVGYVGKEFSGALFILIFLLLTLTFVLPAGRQPYPRVFQQAYAPVTIMSSSVPVRTDEPILEWYETLLWMKYNLPDDAVVCSWWDYGYWITVIGNKTTLADNGTTNGTQIKNIALMFMSNETEATKILRAYDATHVVVFTTFDAGGNDVGYGEEGKWRWMARIAGLNESDFGGYSEETGRWEWNEKGQGTVIYKLMTYGKETKIYGSSIVRLERFKETYFSQGKSYGGVIPLVCVFEIIYEESK